MTLNTPAIVINAQIVESNLRRMNEYASSHQLKLRPHTKTHKSVLIARQQLRHGAAGLTVAKVGEAEVMSRVADDVDLLVAYPAVDPFRAAAVAKLADAGRTIRVAIDSTAAADALASAARSADATIGVLVDLDVGLHRTGVQSPQAALELAQTYRTRARAATRRHHVLPRPRLAGARRSGAGAAGG